MEIKRDSEGNVIQGYGVCVTLPEREGGGYVFKGERSLVAWRSAALAFETIEDAKREIRAMGIEETTQAKRYVATADVCAIY